MRARQLALDAITNGKMNPLTGARRRLEGRESERASKRGAVTMSAESGKRKRKCMQFEGGTSGSCRFGTGNGRESGVVPKTTLHARLTFALAC